MIRTDTDSVCFEIKDGYGSKTSVTYQIDELLANLQLLGFKIA